MRSVAKRLPLAACTVKRSRPIASSSSSTPPITAKLTRIEETCTLSNETTHNYEIGRQGELVDTSPSTSRSDFSPPSPAAFLKKALLPNGFPHTVSPDYLQYQMWALPTHVSGILSTSIVTSSMLKALGISAGTGGAVALGATVQWILKDGVGALGRFFVGGSLSRNFDSDPKYWRFMGELIATGGIVLEISTLLRPDYFLLLASAGTLARAIAKGVSRPSFRVIQQHFASAGFNNIGDVSAKEEVWEVMGQLAGIGLAAAILNSVEGDPDPYGLLVMWALVQSAHIFFRFSALSAVQMRTLNAKRAIALLTAYRDVEGPRRVLTFAEVAQRENLLIPSEWVHPRLDFGTLQDVSAAVIADESPLSVAELLTLFEAEKFVLFWSYRRDRGHVALRVGAEGRDLIKAFALAVELRALQMEAAAAAGNEAVAAQGGEQLGPAPPQFDLSTLRAKLVAVDEWYPTFLADAEEGAGWSFATSNVVILKSDSRFRIRTFSRSDSDSAE